MEFKEWLKHFFDARREAGKPPAADHHMEKLYSTLKQFVRDWSAEGKEERDQTYGPLLEALENEFVTIPRESRGGVRVLVPGAGLGRLAFDICCRGFSSQGNEFSYFMLLASNYILNKSQVTDQHTIYPFVHQFSNVVKADDQLRPVTIPDVLPSSMPFASMADFSMTAGDFIEVYSAEQEKEKWDAVVTCFFMDTAKNVLNYLETMWHVMKPGAVWINLGPLLWHFDNVAGEQSIEFTRDEFIALIGKVGFEWEERLFEEQVPVSYTSNSKSMLQYTYNAFMCVARKPREKSVMC
ncbi:N2227-like protein [Coemansia spiralis]|nr:N2227-like protein [Coemansia spiralis]